MNLEEEIHQIIYNPKLKFFMYNGGAGGEFILNSLSLNSPILEPVPLKRLTPELNRYHLDFPRFFFPMMFAFRDMRMEDILMHSQCSDVSDISTIRSFLDNTSFQWLIRAHACTHPFFLKSNTWYLSLDTESIIDYVNCLKIVKIFFQKVPRENFDWVINDEMFVEKVNEGTFEYERLIEFKNYINHNNLSFIYMGQLHLASQTYNGKNTMSVSEIFDLSVEELVKTLYPMINSRTHPKNPTVKQLVYSELFKKDGQFQEEFKMLDDVFYSEFTQWHLRNLDLLQKFKFDTTNFQFHLN